jgi:hypothetical protein
VDVLNLELLVVLLLYVLTRRTVMLVFVLSSFVVAECVHLDLTAASCGNLLGVSSLVLQYSVQYNDVLQYYWVQE